MSSPSLLLIASESKEQTDKEVYKVLYRSFKDITVTNIWYDPLEKRRAVVLVDGLPELNDKVPDFDQQPAILAWAEKASSLLVKSNDAVTLRYGITDKLKMLFTIKKRGGSPVDFVRIWTRSSLDQCGYFEILFKNAWDATLRASMESWSVEGKQLKVVPLFPCFEEKLESQIEKLIKCKQCINHVNISEREIKMSVEPDASNFDNVKDSEMETIQLSQAGLTSKKKQFKSVAEKQSQIEEDMSVRVQNQVPIMQTCAPYKPSESNKPAREQMQESCRKDHDVDSIEKETRAYLLNNTKGTVFSETKGHAQKISNDNYNDPNSFVDPSDLSKSQTLRIHTVPIHCQSLFLGRLLSKMKCEINSRVDIQYEEDSRIILIHCKFEEGCLWKAAVQATCDSVSKMPTYEQSFLMEDHVNSVIQLRLMQFKLILNCEQKDPRLLVVGEEGRAVPLDTWISSLIVRKSFNVPDNWLGPDAPMELLQKLHSLCKIDIYGESLMLLALDEPHSKKDLDSAVQNISKLLVLSLPSERTERQSGEHAESFTTPDPMDKTSQSVSNKTDDHAKKASTDHWYKQINSKDVGKDSNERKQIEMHSNSQKANENNYSSKAIYNQDLSAWLKQSSEPVSQSGPNKPSKNMDKLYPQRNFSGDQMEVENNSQISLSQSAFLLPYVEKIHCQNLFLGRVLSNMKHENDTLMDLQYDEVLKVVLLHCQHEEGNLWKAAVQATCDGLKMPTCEQTFLMEEPANSIIKQRLMQCKLILNTERGHPCLYISREEGGTMTLETWISSLILRETFSEIPDDWLISDGPWKEVQKFFSLCKIVVHHKSLMLLALDELNSKKDLNGAAQAIHNLLVISKTCKETDGNSQSKGTSNPDEDASVDQIQALPLQKEREQRHNTNKQSTEILKQQFWDSFVLPGLPQLLKSEDGKRMLSKLMDIFQCEIYISSDHGNYSSTVKETLHISGTCYSGAILKTARCRNWKIHLTQSNPTDMNVDMVVDIILSDEVHEATVKQGQIENNLNLFLPYWCCPEGIDCHELFSQQRKKLLEGFTLIFQQIFHLNCQYVAISTDDMKKPGCPSFPAEDVADAVVKALLDTEFQDTLQVYICGTHNLWTFKAFEYALNKGHLFLQKPDESDWDVISNEVSIEALNYTTLQKNTNITIDVVSSTSQEFLFQNDGLCCYPMVFTSSLVIPTLNEDDIRFIEKRVFSQYPDGPLPGQTLNITLKGQQALMYCCAPWGYHAEQALDCALEKIIQYVTAQRKLWIILPGDFHEKILVQKVFQKLDSVVASIGAGSQIYFVCESEQQKQAFKVELKKRTPKSKSWINSIVSYFLPENKEVKENDASSSKINITKSQTPSIELTFLATSESCANQARNQLQQELHKLLKENNRKLTLDPKRVHNIQDLEHLVKKAFGVSACLQHQIQTKVQKKNRKKSKRKKPERLELSVTSLTKNSISDLIHSITEMYGPEVFMRYTEHTKKGESNNASQTLTKATKPIKQTPQNEVTGAGETSLSWPTPGRSNKERHRNSVQTANLLEGIAESSSSEEETEEEMPYQYKSGKEMAEESTNLKRRVTPRLNTLSSDVERNKDAQLRESTAQVHSQRSESAYTLMISGNASHHSMHPAKEQMLPGRLNKERNGNRVQTANLSDETTESSSSEEDAAEEMSYQYKSSKEMAEESTNWKSKVTSRLNALSSDAERMRQSTGQVDSQRNESADTHKVSGNASYHTMPSAKKTIFQDANGANSSPSQNEKHYMDWENKSSEDSSQAVPQRFEWLYKYVSESGAPVMEFCDSETSQVLERAFVNERRGSVKIGSERVNFDHLTVLSKRGDRPLFRMEVFPPPLMDAVLPPPEHWCKEGSRFIPVHAKSANYVESLKLLQDFFRYFSVEILKMEAVESPLLLKRFYCKKQQMRNSQEKVLWHRIATEHKALASQYGLHYNFMAIPKENLPQQRPVCWFSEDVRYCFSQADIDNGREVCLVETRVLTSQELRETSVYTINSDAQAYPMRLITVRVHNWED